MRANEFTNKNIQYKVEPWEAWNGEAIQVKAYAGDNEIGHVIFEPLDDDESQWFATDVEVDAEYQRMGVATKMYDLAKKIAKKQGKIIIRSHTQSGAGKNFWDNNRGLGNNVWESSAHLT